jgi:hypothetical protein
MQGRWENAVYLTIAREQADMLPAFFDGKDKKVIFDEKVTGTSIYYDKATKELKAILGTDATFKIGAADESFIKGDTAKTEMDLDEDAMTELQSAISGWVPAAGDGGAALKTALATFLTKVMADYSNILSTTIKGE